MRYPNGAAVGLQDVTGLDGVRPGVDMFRIHVYPLRVDEAATIQPTSAHERGKIVDGSSVWRTARSVIANMNATGREMYASLITETFKQEGVPISALVKEESMSAIVVTDEMTQSFRGYLELGRWDTTWETHGGGNALRANGMPRFYIHSDTPLGYLINYNGAPDEILKERIAVSKWSDVFVRLAPTQTYLQGPDGKTFTWDEIKHTMGLRALDFRFNTRNKGGSYLERVALATMEFEWWCIAHGEAMEPGTSSEFLVETIEPFRRKYVDGHNSQEVDFNLPCLRNIIIGKPAIVPSQWRNNQLRRTFSTWPMARVRKDPNGMFVDAGGVLTGESPSATTVSHKRQKAYH